MKVLVTGGTGFIGSHTVVELIQAGHEAVLLDDLSNSREEIQNFIGEITGVTPQLYIGDILDFALLDRVFSENSFDAVIHFAAKKSVPESAAEPLMYYENNVSGSISLCQAMKRHGCKKIVFSSSATVYGITSEEPIAEDTPLSPYNVYGNTKYVMEMMMQDLYASDSEWSVTLLRYFNPIGAHDSGLIGEGPTGIPSNLMPYITQVAAGIRSHLNITGTDYDTPDGTGVRDYIHVVDLAKGHVKALDKSAPGCDIYNLGTGTGFSVMQIVKGFEKATGIEIPYVEAPRRAGDLACYFADPSKAKRVLEWQTERSIEDMCRTSWNFAKQYYKK